MTFTPQIKLIVGGALLLIVGAGAVISLMGLFDETRVPNATAGKVNHYLLALSWSPTYCIEAADEADPKQCAADKSHAFILRGLWPQGETASLADCAADKSRVSQTIVEDMEDIMPSARLIGNQWRKHGVCTGLSQDDYFDLMRRAYDRIKIPAEYHQRPDEQPVSPRQLESAFLAANPGLEAEMMSVTCTERHIRDVRICLSPDLTFRTCRGARNECRSEQVTLPPTVPGEALETGPSTASE